MKLNNKGWGIVVFLLFLLMFFAFLLLIAIMVNKLNDEFNQNLQGSIVEIDEL